MNLVATITSQRTLVSCMNHIEELDSGSDSRIMNSIMWQFQSSHQQKDTLHLHRVVEQLSNDHGLRERAETTLHAVAAQEPLFAEALQTPQSPKYHAEGPVLKDHLRLILSVLYGIVEGKVHLLDIEEFRRMKGFEGEIEEMELLIKEYAAFFESFAIAHDVAKWSTVFFVSPKETKGYELGFHMDDVMHREDILETERAKMRVRYAQLFQSFSEEHKTLSPKQLQIAFTKEFGIRIGYPGHDTAVHRPIFRQFVERVSHAHDLTEHDESMLLDMIAHHLRPITEFKEQNTRAIEKYQKFCKRRVYDFDLYINLLQAAFFLDVVCGSVRYDSVNGYSNEFTGIKNFLESEHLIAPERREEKEKIRQREKVAEQNRRFRAVKLDGIALMDLLEMDAGPQFGKVFQRIQQAILEGTKLPKTGKRRNDEELLRRVSLFWEMSFEKGD